MKIVADEQIPYLHDALCKSADLKLCHGRRIGASDLRDADALLVRSVTTVNEDLLCNSQVKFVATATSGDDHVDVDYLRRNGIGFVDAKGSNARSVAEYVLSCLCVLAEQDRFNLSNKTIGVIGCGKVGSRVLALLDALGVTTLPNDPPLQATDPKGYKHYHDLEEVLTADVITMHVPLTDTGNYPTRGLVDVDFLSALKRGAVVINTSRGGIVDERALKNHLIAEPTCKAVLDVWQNEPCIDVDLLAATAIGTPHIAGYSTDAKACAARQVIQATCDFFGIDSEFALPDKKPCIVDLGARSDCDEAVMHAILATYDVRCDDMALRSKDDMDTKQHGNHFDTLRKHYRMRREFPSTVVRVPQHKPSLSDRLKRLGFIVECVT